MNDLIPIGRFARMSRLSIRALRFYAEQGLLVPARVDPSSGYRYYDRVQANRAEAIRILRLIDMPLDEIRELLADDDPDRTGKRLASHRERLRERMAEQDRMLRFLEQLIERGGSIMPYEVTIKNVPPQPVASLTTHTNLRAVGDAVGRGFATLAQGVQAAGTRPTGAPFVIYHDVMDEQHEGRIEICFPVPAGVTAPAGEVTFKEIPGGTVAATTHRGPYAEISPAYHYVTGWIQDNGHQTTGGPREVYLNDPQTVAPEELLTEVQFPIEEG